ncbi:3-hydroxyacyl-CoA dehydrogenase family protein [Oceanicoccus sagamiensis]|uniref:3-hydroxyacyl-CoA dehydrogenase NAD binding domain-containing protein n=1 Tax=Oceanicoccus sagamiensis TaxID=716816 RepID=A0A1X9NKC5_9GAMM|nr:3-hydroxyacyl-CoA dehydrogenase NAD-binding domain-containing protein [Oceanicoccus sagamiensis]ARN75307.1 hypothetical protein BST96_15000 [Oceanicoccus sagamiensis]
MSKKINNVAVIGAGTRGYQIALHGAIKGFSVKCTDINAVSLVRADAFVDDYLVEQIANGDLTPEQVKQVRGRIVFVNSLEEAVQEADLVIEAIVEDLEIKRDLFCQLDRLTPPHTILASNSAAIASSNFAAATTRPDQVLNLHFFNPALAVKMAEVVQEAHVSDKTTAAVMAFCEDLDKEAVHVSGGYGGFTVQSGHHQ